MHNVRPDLNETIEQLKATGIRMTPQRYELVRLLISLEHPTPEQLYKCFIEKYPSVSIATIYNNLKSFKEQGFVQELTFGDRSSRYEWTKAAHDHFTCTGCGMIMDLDVQESGVRLDVTGVTAKGFKVRSHRLELYGLCANCGNG